MPSAPCLLVLGRHLPYPAFDIQPRGTPRNRMSVKNKTKGCPREPCGSLVVRGALAEAVLPSPTLVAACSQKRVENVT